MSFTCPECGCKTNVVVVDRHRRKVLRLRRCQGCHQELHTKEEVIEYKGKSLIALSRARYAMKER